MSQAAKASDTGPTMEHAERLLLIADVLSWRAGSSGPEEQVQQSYVDVVQRNLCAFISALRRTDARTAQQLANAIVSASDADLSRVLLAPEVTYRLAYGGSDNLTKTAKFLVDSFIVEAARRGAAVIDDPMWSALGDTFVSNGRIESWNAQSIPIDLASIRAKDLKYTHFDLGDAERTAALSRVQDAMELINTISPQARYLVQRFTKVLLLKGDRRAVFTSGSAAQYVGRSVLGNPHSPHVDELEVAEALVHEAIHSVLYMHEWVSRWVTSNTDAVATPRVTSPWSGRPLPIRPYLQACFVWFGLLHFWSRALERKAADTTKVRKRIERAAIGFIRGPLMGRLDDNSRASISEPVMACIVEMQRRITESLEATGRCSGPVDLASGTLVQQ